MFRPGLNARCRARLGTGLVAHNSSTELRNVQIRGSSEGFQQWQHQRGLSLERSTSEATMKAREAVHVVSPMSTRRHQSGAMLASLPSVSPSNLKQSTSNHTSDSCNREDAESSADSDGPSKSSTMSDGDSVNMKDKQHLLRITCGASMVAQNNTEANERDAKMRPTSESMLEEKEGENEVDEDVNIRPESPARNSELETPSVQGEPDSRTTWTDDKHSSFLNSMEATFVRSLYSQQGLDHLGVYGESAQVDDSEQDCVESRPVDAYGCCTSFKSELFELVQGGQQHQKSYPRSLDPPPGATKTAVLANPWVQHFKQRTSNSEDLSNHPSTCPLDVIATPFKEIVSAVDVSQKNLQRIEKDDDMTAAAAEAYDAEEKPRSGGSEDIENKETRNCEEVPEIEKGFRLWQHRLQTGGQPVVNPTSRKDTATWVLKRPPNFDVENADVLVTKRIKSTQLELAQKDLEMLEQYVAKQQAEIVQAAGEHSELALLENARKVVDTSGEEAGPSSASEQTDTRKVVRSAMDQVVPLLGRMNSYESRSSVSFPDLNAPSHFPTGAASCAVATIAPTSEVREREPLLSSVPDLNAPPRTPNAPAYTTNQPTINFTKEGEAVATGWSPRPEVGSMEERYFHDLAGSAYQSFVQSSHEGDAALLSLELPTKSGETGETPECEPQLSPVSNSRTWTWGLGGFRRRVHEHTVVVSASQPPRSLRDGIHFSDPVPFRASGQQV